MTKLIEFAQRFRKFLGFAAFVLLGLILTTTYLFSRGSFDQILSGFDRLSATQFVNVVFAILGGAFVLIMTLVVLAFVRTGQAPRGGVIYIYVHEDKHPTKSLANTTVTLLLPEPKSDTTDLTGTTKFVFPADLVGREFLCGIRRDGFEESTKKVILKDTSRYMMGLKPDPVRICELNIVHWLEAKGGAVRRSVLASAVNCDSVHFEAAYQSLLRSDVIRTTASADPMVHVVSPKPALAERRSG